MLYIKGNYETIEVVTGIDKKKIDMSITKYLNKLAVDNLCTVNGIKEAVKRKYKINSKIPLCINKDIILFLVTSKVEYDKIYINSRKVLKIKGDQNSTTIYFSCCKIDLDVSFYIVKGHIDKCNMISEGEMEYEKNYKRY